MKKLLVLLFISLCLACVYFIPRYEVYKGRFIIIIDEIMLPYRIAKLSAEPADSSLFMPVVGAHVRDVTDTWGGARSQGRSHEGQDIFAPRGTPVLSATRGYIVRLGVNRLGGNSIFVLGPGGRRYYYAHLDRYNPLLSIGDYVTATTTLGFVGNTGNASGTPPHLHFGMYNNGAQNPYPLLIDRE
jgi:murein DD-endopeptidase MepM/ murein hydrolase activator NlpD